MIHPVRPLFLMAACSLLSTLCSPGRDTGWPSTAMETRTCTYGGKRTSVGSELGTLYVLDTAGQVAFERDLGALPVAACTPELYHMASGSVALQLSRYFADDNPTGTPQDRHTAVVTLTDSEGATDSQSVEF